MINYLVGGIPTYPSEKYESNGSSIPNIWKHKIHVPNHQPAENSSEHLGRKKKKFHALDFPNPEKQSTLFLSPRHFPMEKHVPIFPQVNGPIPLFQPVPLRGAHDIPTRNARGFRFLPLSK